MPHSLSQPDVKSEQTNVSRGGIKANQSFGFLDMFVTEEELAIEVAEIDSVKIHNVDLTKAGEYEILKQLASNAAGTDHQYTRLRNYGISAARKL